MKRIKCFGIIDGFDEKAEFNVTQTKYTTEEKSVKIMTDCWLKQVSEGAVVVEEV